MDRLTTLQQLWESEDPDPFTAYALAMEWKARGDAAEMERWFDTALRLDPTNTAVYYQWGQFAAEAGDREIAREKLTAGLVYARTKGERGTAREFEEALEALDEADV